ncbi:MAG: helix-turn-helix domain-containing protein [Acidobacteria bacterium]|nr:helix-turn-helix domain-containing protein [Acidobacteriota bacterium]
MHVLTDVIDSLRLRGSLYFGTDFTAPWGVDVPEDTNVCRFHVVTQGRCWLTVPSTGEVRLLSQGDLALVPHGNGHLLQEDPATPAVGLGDVLESADPGPAAPLVWGGGGERTRMVCGYFAFDRGAAHPLLDGLPSIVHVPASPDYDFAWIDQLVRFIAAETSAGRPGSLATVRRLSEILFVQCVRYQAEHGATEVPFLRTLFEPGLGDAMRAMHAQPAAAWTLASLARQAGMSRTTFAARFSRSFGATAIEYLTSHRMDVARRLLGAGAPAKEVAQRVGYESEAAFSRRFKSVVGMGPGAYRRRVSSLAAHTA